MTCTKCAQERDPTEFRTRSSTKQARWCRQCEREYQRAWYWANAEKNRERKRLWMAADRATPEGRERQRARQKAAYDAGYHVKAKAYLTNLRERHFFRYRAQRYGQAERLEPITAQWLARLWKQQRGRCAITDRKLDRTAQLDHVTPLARGGLTERANLRWVCPEINRAKRDLTDDELAALLTDCMAWIGRRIQLVEEVAP